jgi:ABC-type phosphate/phosphonate transport system substrate-binding protein
MYQMPELEPAVSAWWQGLRQHLVNQGLNDGDLPKLLIKPEDYYAHWRNPTLLLSQTCGFPLTHELHNQVQYVATQSYQTAYTKGPTYCSLVLVHKTNSANHISQLKHTRLAVNSDDSQSGYHALRRFIAPLAGNERFFSEVVHSGSHRQSMALVASREADVCAVDCVTYGLLQTHAPATVANLRVLTATQSAPGLPYVTSLATSPATLIKLRGSLAAAALDPALKSIRQQLLMGPVEVIEGLSPYQEIINQAEQANALGYRQLV